MGDFQGPIILSPPPSSSSSDKSSTTMLYYGLVVVGIAAMALALYNFIIVKRSRRHHMVQSQGEGPNGLVMVMESSNINENCQSQRNNNNLNLLTSFNYKKKLEGGVVGDDYDYECPICLCCFEEGEEVRKLPRCKHSFHAPCIDMWLYSHYDCPICRTHVVGSLMLCQQRLTHEDSGPGLWESGGGGGGVVSV